MLWFPFSFLLSPSPFLFSNQNETVDEIAGLESEDESDSSELSSKSEKGKKKKVSKGVAGGTLSLIP